MNGDARRSSLASALLALGLLWSDDRILAQPSAVTLETEDFRYAIGSDGRNLEFTDKRSGIDYCDQRAGSRFAEIVRGGKRHSPSSVSRDGDLLIVEFSGARIRVALDIEIRRRYVELRVASVSEKVDSLVFLNLPLTLKASPRETFGACALALNLFTRVEQLPALQTRLRATCYSRFGVVGAAAAIVGAPPAEVLSVLREVIRNAADLPQTTASGPWANEVVFNRGSYLFNFGALTEENVDEWIDMVKGLGFDQIDCHGGGSRFFRFGDFHLNETKWPRGWDDYKNIVRRLHEEGIGAIFHTYAFFIDKRARYVTPVPHPQLDAFGTFTLAEPLSEDAREIRVVESTRDVSTITGFFVRNSVTLRIGDELITFSGASKEPPYRFTGCQRGAHGTRAAPHPKGVGARHLKECFGLFVPDAESELFEEIAAGHAEIINRCDFDGLYLDAIDGSDILRGAEQSWYYASKFVHAIWKRLKKPIGMEMSSMWHHFWQFRSRWQAWDYPNRGHKRFIDIHASSVDGGLLLPLHLGWWNFQVFSPPQVEPSYPDVIDYLGSRLIGYDAGVSLTGSVNRQRLRDVPAFRRLVDRLRRYEELRRADYFDESIKTKLIQPGREFTLFQDEAARWRFRPVQYDHHRVRGVDAGSHRWLARNEFGRQPLKLRLEILMSAAPYDSPGAVVLTDFASEKERPEARSASGVTSEIQPSPERVKAGRVSGRFSALSSGRVPRNGAWTRIRRNFEPWLDLGKHRALGVWIHGDGQGQLLNLRLESPRHIAHGAIADRYVDVDFEGWRYFQLIETESSRYSDYSWPDGWALYHVYRELIDFSKIESLSVWYQNLPAGRRVECYLSPVKALPMAPLTIRNPRLAVGGRTLVFPVEAGSGSYLEFYSPADCKLYGPKGELIGEVSPLGDVPRLESGQNEVTFSCDEADGLTTRVNVTVISYGEAL